MLTSHSPVSESTLTERRSPERPRRNFMNAGGLWGQLAVFCLGLVSGYCIRAVKGQKVPNRQRTALKKPTGRQWNYKMVLVVNSQLKMGKGKIAAQCAHAACGVLEECKDQHAQAFRNWSANGQPKIAVQTNDLDTLHRQVRKTSLPHYLVCDAGKTQIPAGSHTVLAIGPALNDEVDELTGTLRLL